MYPLMSMGLLPTYLLSSPLRKDGITWDRAIPISKILATSLFPVHFSNMLLEYIIIAIIPEKWNINYSITPSYILFLFCLETTDAQESLLVCYFWTSLSRI